MKAKIAFLTSPAPNVFTLNFQIEGEDRVTEYEISRAHLANILITGTSLALQDQFHRVQIHTTSAENAEHDTDSRRQQPA